MSRGECLPLLLLAFAFLLLSARDARACSCGGTPTVLDAFERADLVVVTRAVSVEMSEKAAQEGRIGDGEHYVHGVRSTRMAVERVYKGGAKAGEELVFGQGGGADCIWTFSAKDVGRQFLFYLKRFGDSSVWAAGTCGRSRQLQYAADDLLYLNRLDEVRGKTRLSGTVAFDRDGGPGVAGRLIRVVGEKKSYEVRTDASGVYEVYDLPPGEYTVEPEVPAGWRVDGFWLRYSPSVLPPKEGEDPRLTPAKIPVSVPAGRHAALDIHFEISNAIRGVISDAEGRPMNGVCIDLVPADGTKGAYLADCTETGGRFEIDEIPPGRYVILVNDDGKVSSTEPFGAFYHPNALKREDAAVFEIGLGDILEGVQVRAPKGEEVITVEGALLYSDGKPVAEESVEFKAAGVARDEDGETRGAVEADARAKTDERGRFRIKILKGLSGELYGTMLTFEGEFENCPKLDALVKKSGGDMLDVKTPALKLEAGGDLYGVELKFAFPGCKKAKIE